MTQKIHCAIYTRKSSEEGLDQSFNSLDAQREACEAYVKSQRHEGWHALSARYDDGGFSDGNMDRPALKRLMIDIEDGKINTVVVYKVDRLTRSLADFAKIIERFDAQKVSFVSVTQQFNTTSSMGRLTLNVLLSFAQFEREVTGERIRDKIAASKKKGMWMGGYVPLGYDLRDRQIHINPKEAETVRAIFTNYLRLRCVMSLKGFLDQNRILSKPRILSTGTKTGETSFSRGALYKILSNHIYVGEIEHKGAIYPGRHKAIIDRDEWNRVQKLLAENRQGVRRGTRVTKASLFTGILYDAAGNRYTPTHSNKSGRRYRYYTSQAVIHKATASDCATRIPAHDIEMAAVERLHQFLKSPPELLKNLTFARRRPGQYAGLLEMATARAAAWRKTSAPQRERFLKAILDRVVVHSGSVEVKIRTKMLIQELSGRKVPQEFGGADVISLSCPYRYDTRGKALRLIIEGSEAPSVASSTTILRAIARVRLWRDQLVSGEAKDIFDLARKHRITPRYIRRLFRLASLSPESIELLLNQQSKRDLSLDQLCNQISIDWREQVQVFS